MQTVPEIYEKPKNKAATVLIRTLGILVLPGTVLLLLSFSVYGQSFIQRYFYLNFISYYLQKTNCKQLTLASHSLSSHSLYGHRKILLSKHYNSEWFHTPSKKIPQIKGLVLGSREQLYYILCKLSFFDCVIAQTHQQMSAEKRKFFFLVQMVPFIWYRYRGKHHTESFVTMNYSVKAFFQQ